MLEVVKVSCDCAEKILKVLEAHLRCLLATDEGEDARAVLDHVRAVRGILARRGEKGLEDYLKILAPKGSKTEIAG